MMKTGKKKVAQVPHGKGFKVGIDRRESLLSLLSLMS
jgi:hypothetical protein